MDKNELKERTKKFALRIIKLVNYLPKTDTGRVIGKQILRSGTSVGANYRAACRARSKSEFVAKLGIVVEEADESCYWLELILEIPLIKPELVQSLLTEAEELTAIMYKTRDSTLKNLSKGL